MKLQIFPRTAGKKSDANKVRCEGNIPVVVYGKKLPAKTFYVKGDDLQTVLRGIRSGLLATTVFELQDGDALRKALVKDVQYHPATYAILHLDFDLVTEDQPVQVNVPLQILGVAECVGIKLGGFLRQVIRSLRVACRLKDLPQELTLDVRELNISQSQRLSDIALPAGVRPLAKMNEVAVVIAKKA